MRAVDLFLESMMIYYMAGVWDLFHIGHLNALKKARETAKDNFLIIGVVTDESCLDYKGKSPIIPFEERRQIIESLKMPDIVVPQYTQFSFSHMKNLNVDVILLGDDWITKKSPHLQKMSLHIPIIYLPRTKNISSTGIQKRILRENKE